MRFGLLFAGLLVVFAGLGTTQASGEFGLKGFDAQISSAPSSDPGQTTASSEGGFYTQAGGHPYSIITHIEWNSHDVMSPEFGTTLHEPDGDIKDVKVELPPGLLGNPNPQALPQCTAQQLAGAANSIDAPSECPVASQVGMIRLQLNVPFFTVVLPLFNMKPPTGMPARFGFNVAQNYIYLDTEVRSDGDYGITIGPSNAPQALRIYRNDVTFWGVPADPRHDAQRCNSSFFGWGTTGKCPGGIHDSTGVSFEPHAANIPPKAFLTMPTSCTESGVGEAWRMRTDSWEKPGVFSTGSFLTHRSPYAPEPGAPGGIQQGPTGCFKVPFEPKLALQPTGQSTDSPTGLDVRLDVPTDGIFNPTGIAQSTMKKAVVTLPEGMSLNPSQGEGLGVCSRADLARETASSAPGSGCPSTSKIGSLDLATPLLDHPMKGSIYLAEPDNVRTTAPGAENRFDSLVGLYFVVQDRESGVLIKLEGKVDTDPQTGQITTTFDNLPQLPFTSFTIHFREGARSPLSTPSACGTYTTEATFTPHANPDTVSRSRFSFEIDSGIGGAPCPSGGVRPFTPKLDAGAINNNAGSFSPFFVRMFRTDEQQEITNFSTSLPPGVAAKLAGIPRCSDAQLAQMAQQTGVEAQTNPACPRASQVGRVLAGFGVGSVLTYAPGQMYLAGPYRGTPVSIATVAPATVGPFDLGTVVVRSAFSVDPQTAEVTLDSRASDPIPHILRGFPLHLRDIRIYLDRPGFTNNPTNCNRMEVGAFLSGAGRNFASPVDDPLVDVSNPFQVSNCALLPFKPKLSFRLKGGTKRGDFPALRATLKARPGDANLAKAVVALPKSEFLEQGHIGTVCTRVQFAADNCPAASIYGNATATTPLLDEPVSGPVYLRSSSNELPDLVIALKGEISVNAVGRIDSVNGGIRTTFETIPDTPIDTFTLRMQGGKKGLFVNSRNLCLKPARADVKFFGQNGKVAKSKPKMGISCGKGRKRSPKTNR
jgi:hypothetical protein